MERRFQPPAAPAAVDGAAPPADTLEPGAPGMPPGPTDRRMDWLWVPGPWAGGGVWCSGGLSAGLSTMVMGPAREALRSGAVVMVRGRYGRVLDKACLSRAARRRENTAAC